MKIIEKKLGCILLEPRIITDNRGWFQIPFNKEELNNIGIPFEDVCQMNHSHSLTKGIVRGPNYQEEPFEQAKLVRVVKGSVYSVGIDINPTSATWGQSAEFYLSAKNKYIMYIPRGYAHGFTVLEDETELEYFTDNIYNYESAKSIVLNDERYNHGKGIDWTMGGTVEIDLQRRSEKNISAPCLFK